MLKEFNSEVEALLKNNPVLENVIPQLRDKLRIFLSNEDFKLDCIEKVVSSIYEAISKNEI